MIQLNECCFHWVIWVGWKKTQSTDLEGRSAMAGPLSANLNFCQNPRWIVAVSENEVGRGVINQWANGSITYFQTNRLGTRNPIKTNEETIPCFPRFQRKNINLPTGRRPSRGSQSRWANPWRDHGNSPHISPPQYQRCPQDSVTRAKGVTWPAEDAGWCETWVDFKNQLLLVEPVKDTEILEFWRSSHLQNYVCRLSIVILFSVRPTRKIYSFSNTNKDQSSIQQLHKGTEDPSVKPQHKSFIPSHSVINDPCCSMQCNSISSSKPTSNPLQLLFIHMVNVRPIRLTRFHTTTSPGYWGPLSETTAQEFHPVAQVLMGQLIQHLKIWRRQDVIEPRGPKEQKPIPAQCGRSRWLPPYTSTMVPNQSSYPGWKKFCTTWYVVFHGLSHYL